MYEGSWLRRWSPWTLRAELRYLRSALVELRLRFDSDELYTEAERNIRHADAILAGHPDPGEYAVSHRVEGATLVIDCTGNGHQYDTVTDAPSTATAPAQAA